MKSVIFDLDGTLADTAPDLIGALNAIAAREGWPALDPVADRITAGAGGRALLRRGMAGAGLAADEARVDSLFQPFLEAYAARIAQESRLFPGAEDCLHALAAQGWALGVCTNKPVGLARALLDALGVAGLFAAVLGADSLPVRKPDPRHLLETIALVGGAPERSILIGDTITDVETARRAGRPCVLCRFGYAAQPLAELAVAAEIDSLTEIAALAPRLIAQPPLTTRRRARNHAVKGG